MNDITVPPDLSGVCFDDHVGPTFVARLLSSIVTTLARICTGKRVGGWERQHGVANLELELQGIEESLVELPGLMEAFGMGSPVALARIRELAFQAREVLDGKRPGFVVPVADEEDRPGKRKKARSDSGDLRDAYRLSLARKKAASPVIPWTWAGKGSAPGKGPVRVHVPEKPPVWFRNREAIVARWKQGDLTLRQVADEFGVSPTTVYNYTKDL